MLFHESMLRNESLKLAPCTLPWGCLQRKAVMVEVLTHVESSSCVLIGLRLIVCSLEGKDLVLELADGTGLLEAKALGGLLQAADHGGRSAHQDLDIVGGLGQPFLRSN